MHTLREALREKVTGIHSPLLSRCTEVTLEGWQGEEGAAVWFTILRARSPSPLRSIQKRCRLSLTSNKLPSKQIQLPPGQTHKLMYVYGAIDMFLDLHAWFSGKLWMMERVISRNLNHGEFDLVICEFVWFYETTSLIQFQGYHANVCGATGKLI